MDMEFSFYTNGDFEKIESLILNAYEWEYPIMGISRLEFAKGLNGDFTGMRDSLERTCGLFHIDGKLVSCAINENTAEGDAFFLFDTKEHAMDRKLIKEMLTYAKTWLSTADENHKTRVVNLRIPEWNEVLAKEAEAAGFTRTDCNESSYIKPFSKETLPVQLPEGYTLVDGETTPDFYLANIHMQMFNYPMDERKHSEEAFHKVRRMKHYDKQLDLCVLDPMKRPVAMAIIWCDEKMPYCELEPLGVVWWERRKHLASAILNEATNRVKALYPNCKGMLGGEQIFYQKCGYELKSKVPIYQWKMDVYPSWDKRSLDRHYGDEL